MKFKEVARKHGQLILTIIGTLTVISGVVLVLFWPEIFDSILFKVRSKKLIVQTVNIGKRIKKNVFAKRTNDQCVKIKFIAYLQEKNFFVGFLFFLLQNSFDSMQQQSWIIVA